MLTVSKTNQPAGLLLMDLDQSPGLSADQKAPKVLSEWISRSDGAGAQVMINQNSGSLWEEPMFREIGVMLCFHASPHNVCLG